MLLFDNLIVTDDVAVAEQWAKATFDLKRAKISRDSVSKTERQRKKKNLFNTLKKYTIFKLKKIK